MSMGSGSGRVIPPLTVRMARASNPRGTAAMWVRDRLDELFVDEDFSDWFPADGRRGPSSKITNSIISVRQSQRSAVVERPSGGRPAQLRLP